MKPALRYLAVGVAVYLLTLVVTLPADLFRNTLQDRVPGLEMSRVSGSVFSGQAARVNFKGQELGPVDWDIRPFALLLLRLEYRFGFSHPDNTGHATVGIKPGSDVYGHDLDMRLAVNNLVNRFSPVELRTRGTLGLRLDHFEIGSEGVHAVTGTARWQGAAIESPLALPLGEIGLNLESRDKILVADVINGGDLGVSGEILLQPGNRYALDLILRPGVNVSGEITGMLETAMEPHPSGGFLLKMAGSF